MKTNAQTVCGVLTENSDLKIYTVSMLISTGADNYHTKTKTGNAMPNNCFTKYIFHADVLTYLPYNSHKHLHIAKIKTFRSFTLTYAAVKKFPTFITLFT